MTKAKAKVLKDFSELKPVDKRIELVAAGICQIVFKGEMNDDFKPKQGTQTHRMWKMGKLSLRHQIAWRYFNDDILTAHGKSGKVGSSYGEYTDHGGGDGFRVPVAYSNAPMRRLEDLLARFLDRRERALLVDLWQDTVKGDSSLQLETIGLILSGYKHEEYARVAGIVHVQGLLARLATYYRI
jgi:hypothetical protein